MPKKKYGQNFLINKCIIKKILTDIKINSQNILEVGPGNLALTKLIIDKLPNRYVGIEIDKDFKTKINDKQILSNILFDDALEINERSLFHNKNFTIISNLPYNISSQLLIKWCILQNDHHCINEMILMFQKELGERILSGCNSKKYGSLSVLVQAFFNIKRKVIVSKECFNPVPKVESIVLHFLPLKKNRIKKEKFKNLQKITKFFFNERRKKNKKKIQKLFNETVINNHNLQKYFDLRAENLSKDLYYKFTEII
jgi:16S rRNA (adenine1518-N6/adenine1519-N6)-dimethyltransferase